MLIKVVLSRSQMLWPVTHLWPIMWAAGQDRSTSDTCIHQTLPVPSVKGIWHGAAWLVCAYHLGCGCPDQQHAAQG